MAVLLSNVVVHWRCLELFSPLHFVSSSPSSLGDSRNHVCQPISFHLNPHVLGDKVPNNVDRPLARHPTKKYAAATGIGLKSPFGIRQGITDPVSLLLGVVCVASIRVLDNLDHLGRPLLGRVVGEINTRVILDARGRTVCRAARLRRGARTPGRKERARGQDVVHVLRGCRVRRSDVVPRSQGRAARGADWLAHDWGRVRTTYIVEVGETYWSSRESSWQ